MRCPACNSPMFVMEYDQLELDHCPACEGVWFDATELALLFDDHEALGDDAIAGLPEADTTERRRRCPHCRRRLRKVNIGGDAGVLIDACPDGHGVYFDRGEVAELARGLAPASGDLPRRVRVFLGDAYRCGDAANETEST